MNKKVIAVSGGFDPIHIGHIRMIQDAAKLGDVIVFLNTDRWLKNKKGYVFMSWSERSEILLSIKGVKHVYDAMDTDNTVCQALELYRPDIFANGGDRKEGNVPEYKICESLGITMVFNAGGNEKPQSSSSLVERVKYAKIDHGDGIVF